MTERSTRGTSSAGRPVRPALTRDYIIRTAMALIDRDGVSALSMRKLGAELGVDPMAVYYYLPNKSALFDGLIEAVYTEIETAFDAVSEGSWREQVATFMRAMREVLRRHPNLLSVIATRPAYAPSVLAFGDRAIGLVQSSGFTGREILHMVNCLRTFTVGHVFAEMGDPVGGPTTSPEAVNAMILESYPNLAEAISGGYQPDEEYELGLQALLDGFEQRLSRS
ncbi:TetR/AcrR family transcriptional regulator [Micromonospora sp. NPDC050200]|uniref:TetR/AcrR family transcriptional regulator n=1 Tax=Micromonospora sp. NPDC050200 TaxID=3155664 RepID=UPI0034071E94